MLEIRNRLFSLQLDVWIVIGLTFYIICVAATHTQEEDKRRLIADASQSIISGNGTVNFTQGDMVTISVQAKDSSGVDITTGGDVFIIHIQNECKLISGSYCEPVSNQRIVINPEIFDEMADHNNGTYTYDYTADADGILSVSVLTSASTFDPDLINVDWWNNESRTGASIYTETVKSINFVWKTGDYYPGHSGGVGGVYTFSLVGPITGQISFKFAVNFCASLSCDGTVILPETCGTVSGSFSMVQDQVYACELIYHDASGDGYLRLYWQYSGFAEGLVPTSAYYSLTPVGLSPINVKVKCQSGYVGYPNFLACVFACGNGQVDASEAELCDDGNTNDDDGCSADCSMIKDNYICYGGDASSQDICEVCSPGFPPDSTQTVCKPKCGDSRRVGSESCDDGNTVSGDGCPSDCASLEVGWVCAGGDIDNADVCEECTQGYTTDSTFSECIPVCGDDSKVEEEKCDDGNLVEGDGCSNECSLIDQNYICTGGNIGKISICRECSIGYEPNIDQSKCIIIPLSAEAAAAGGASFGVAGLGLGFNIASSVLSSASPQSSFSSINMMQLLLLLPLVGAFIPLEVVQYLSSLSMSTFNLPIFKPTNLPLLSDAVRLVDIEQHKPYLILIGLESGSSLINLIALLGLTSLLPIVHILLCLIKMCTKKCNQDKCFPKFINKSLKSMLFGMYIRMFLELYIFIALSVLGEISSNTFGSIFEIISFSIGTLTSLFCIFVFGIAIQQWLKSRSPAQYKRQKYFTEFFNGTKDSFICRFYSVLYLIRRSLFAILVSLFYWMPMYARITLYCFIQLTYFIIYCIIRPFESKKDNLLEIFNELTYLVLCILLCYYNSEDIWDATMASVYIYIIIFNMLTTAIIALISLIKTLISKYKQCKQKSKVESRQNFNNEETQNQTQLEEEKSASKPQTQIASSSRSTFPVQSQFSIDSIPSNRPYLYPSLPQDPDYNPCFNRFPNDKMYKWIPGPPPPKNDS